MRVKSKASFLLIIYLLTFLLLGMDSSFNDTRLTKSKVNSAYDVIAAVNQLRVANGLSAYQVDGSLMASAQAHSEYQASIGSITHTGRGGSDVKSRAVAAGYGGGAAVSVIENIFGGTNATPQQAVNSWQGDSLHLNTLLSSKAVDVGAGVATDGNLVYYTLDVGYIVGSAGSGNSSGSGSSTSASSLTGPATAIAFYPVLVSTPNPDGSVIHIVQSGQTLWSIAATYKIDLADLLILNDFTNNTFIYPGQKITVRKSDSLPNLTSPQRKLPIEATLTHEPKDIASPEPATEVAKMETSEGITPSKADQLAPTHVLTYSSIQRSWNDKLLGAIAIFVLGGIVLMIIGSVLQRRK